MTTTQLSDFSVTDLIIQPVQKNAHNSIFAPITYRDTKYQPRLQVGDDPLRAPFGCTSFDNNVVATRLNLDLSVPRDMKHILEVFKDLDDHIVDHVWINISLFFPKKAPPSKEALREMYCGLLKSNGDFDPLLKTKINSTALVWTVKEGVHTKTNIDAIESGCTLIPVIQIDKIWTMPSRFGVTAVTCAAMVFPREDRKMEDVFSSKNHLIKYDLLSK
jgi:hypothetical protein